ncbi:hypothetical protein [Halapricum hydrolyticum]|uniref:Uncharacterized protein n=1 Tax=Halapricum hydrolyticum TaxID=2979991 RepID=A0AAE3IAJ3_9EURY|nr:hypothetical protein [Halapricum hydrolyticum]MCU4717402.1 hypothetical protein [Halapricum hydrolyticum]MCU4726566.1 hypothetical protein [Halapricum hydrolyticum]
MTLLRPDPERHLLDRPIRAIDVFGSRRAARSRQRRDLILGRGWV